MTITVMALVVVGVQLATRMSPPPKCVSVMNQYCNGPHLETCNQKIVKDGGTLPTVALKDTSLSSNTPAWRCYSPTCLEDGPSGEHYKGDCRMYCTTPALEDVLENCTDPAPPPSGHEINVTATDVWGQFAKDCGEIRTPELVKTPTNMLLIGQCRSAGSVSTTAPPNVPNCTCIEKPICPTGSHAVLSGNCGGHGQYDYYCCHSYTGSTPKLSDDMRRTKIVMIESTDGGATWGKRSNLTDISNSVGVGVYDSKRDTIVLQYQSFTSSNPYTGNTLWQKTSTDRGMTWSVAKNMSKFLIPCNSGSGGQVCGAAGSRLQTTSGRIVFSGHEGGGNICVWYSDDGGETYEISSPTLFTGNEQSIADLGNGTLYMNGRGTQFSFAGTRASYWSFDNGLNWTQGREARNLREPNSFGCDGAVIAVPNRNPSSSTPPRVFFSEPAGPGGRISLRVWCSVDGGLTWTKYVGINQGDVAAYSALEYTVGADGEPTLLVVWEQRPTMLSYRLKIDDWCPEL